ncbi:MAG: hypothetical protein KKA28_16595, partial [Planctomycetes bacterium]|nr:hypothetical protein [Planctomycetota bacterium]MCG2685245.1 hypothetical protein [Planctomycetales bacterium]
MNVVYPLFAASSWPIAVMLAVPVFVVLFGLAFFFARTPLQRLANMLLGLLGSVVVLSFSVWYFSELHFLRKCPACVSFHWRNQWSVQFSVARRFAISERKLVLQGFYLQQV